MEDLCNAAVKEEAIETKLNAVAEQWAQEIFTFADHKSRGPVVLKVGGWGEGVGMRASALRWVTRHTCHTEEGSLLPACCPPVGPLTQRRRSIPTPAQPSDTSELMERLEDSLMTLGSMATNRYAAPFRTEVQAWIRCGAVGFGPQQLLACHCRPVLWVLSGEAAHPCLPLLFFSGCPPAALLPPTATWPPCRSAAACRRPPQQAIHRQRDD